MAEGIGGQDAALMAGVLRAMRIDPGAADCVRTQVLEQKRYIGRTLVERAIARGELASRRRPRRLARGGARR